MIHVLSLWARRVLITLAAVFFFGLTFLPALQIVLRLVGKPFIGAEELTRFFLICMVFLSYPLVVANKENIVMGELKNLLPAAMRRGLAILIDLCSLLLTFFITYAAYETVLGNMRSYTPTLEIPFWVFLSCTFVAFLCSGFIHTADLVRKLSSKSVDTHTTSVSSV